ncbi:MAG: hypothetical protein ABI903_00845 [Actinomycetota bacterium]
MDPSSARRKIGPGPLSLPVSSLAVPGIAALLGSLFLAWRPGVARSMLGSPRAAGFTLLVGAIVIGIGWWLPRLGRRGLTTGLVQTVPVLLAAVVTVLPAFRNVTVNEPFPQQATGGADILVGQEARPPSGVVGRAGLHGIDHRASGDVLLALGIDGSYVVRLERLDVEPGPDYQVYLVPGSAADPSGGVRLDHLRGTAGARTTPSQSRRSRQPGSSRCSSGAGPLQSRWLLPPSALGDGGSDR